MPVGRWRGFGGSTDFNGTCMETYTWAAALAAQTEHIMLFSTSHAPTIHPIVAAKQGATIDHISNGRWGLNIVCGWFTPEMEMFGAKQMDHAERYRYAGSGFRSSSGCGPSRALITGASFFRSRTATCCPTRPAALPHADQRRLLAGRQGLCRREVDFNFMAVDTLENGKAITTEIKQLARQYQRQIGIMTYGLVVCCDTEKEARQKYRYIVEKGDWEAARTILGLLGIESESFSEQHLTEFAERFIAGWGGYPLIGTPNRWLMSCANCPRLAWRASF